MDRLPHDPLTQLLGTRLDGVTHMCPDCGLPPRAFCVTCHGRGNITEAELSVWQRKALGGMYS